MIDLIQIRNRSNDMRTNMSPVVKRLQPAPNLGISVLHELRLPPFTFHVHPVVCGRSVRVYPLLHFDYAGAIIELVGYVCRLGADVADLADECDLGYFGAVDLEVCVWMGLLSVEDLFDRAGAEGIFAVAGLEFTA